jgi:hypothetical protein
MDSSFEGRGIDPEADRRVKCFAHVLKIIEWKRVRRKELVSSLGYISSAMVRDSQTYSVDCPMRVAMSG